MTRHGEEVQAVASVDPAVTPTDADVVAQVLGGDRERFSILMRRHNRRLFRVARAIVRDDSEALDVVQEGYVNAYAHLGQFATNSAFSTWLTRIVINAALAHRRVSGRARQLASTSPDPDWRSGTAVTSPEDDACRRELTLLLERAIDELPHPYRLTLVLRELEGLSTTEVAASLGITEEAVRTRLHRTRELLREDLARHIGSEKERLFHFGGANCDELVRRVLAILAPTGPHQASAVVARLAPAR
jgi:RNA polymerase sigma-70 factor (ECF subfamily)